MDRRERQAFDPGQGAQPRSGQPHSDEALSDQELAGVNAGANLVAGLGGPDTRPCTDHTKWIDVISVSY